MNSPSDRWKNDPKARKAIGVFVLCAAALVFAATNNVSHDSSGTAKPEQRPTFEPGSQASTNRGYAGCRQVEDSDKFTALMAAGDTVAALAFVDHSDCKLMPEGTQGRIDERSIWHRAICIREEGQPFCSWIPQAIAKKADEEVNGDK